jgi:hypothetical protein
LLCGVDLLREDPVDECGQRSHIDRVSPPRSPSAYL